MKNEHDNYVITYFRIKHEGCWSELTSNNKFEAITLIARPNKDKRFILAYDEVKLNNYNLKNFIRDLKGNNRVKEIFKIRIINNKRNIYRLLLKEDYENMVRGILDKYTLFDIKDLILNGEERIVLVLPSSEIIELKKDFENIGKLIKFTYKYINIDELLTDSLLTIFNLTKREHESFKLAYKSGFYDLPKNITLEELASYMKISKPTMEDYIRKAERKIFKSFYHQYYYYDMLLEGDSEEDSK
ncbi:bacterio-opsin activator [Acidianus manzaensis]|uniref:Bacterio-opsin activator n=1 Tax=Acidianus manzaensis TaxID=282676 RepID=A0A1W6K3E1_9CREN|nr:bacterio-opsin activator [Acidianus manzaensis]